MLTNTFRGDRNTLCQQITQDAGRHHIPPFVLKQFQFFSFKIATAGWTQLGIHHLILQTAPQFLLSQLILSASPPMNPPGHARIYELEWRMPTRRLTTELEWTVSDEEGETFPPRKVRSQPCHQEEEATQRLKRSVFSFKVSKSSLKVSKFQSLLSKFQSPHCANE